MLANLTSLIWGSGNAPVTATTTTTTITPSPDPTTTKDAYEDSPEGFTDFNIRATTPTDEEEADWVLVDRAGVSFVVNTAGVWFVLISFCVPIHICTPASLYWLPTLWVYNEPFLKLIES